MDIGGHIESLDAALSVTRGCDSIPTSIFALPQPSWLFESYPNPARDEIYIVTDATDGFHYSLSELSGRILLAGFSAANETSVDTRALMPGVYLLHIRSGHPYGNRLVLIQ